MWISKSAVNYGKYRNPLYGFGTNCFLFLAFRPQPDKAFKMMGAWIYGELRFWEHIIEIAYKKSNFVILR